MAESESFDELFRRATGNAPYPYQCRLAGRATTPALLRVPTGSGKTQAVLLNWLWRRRFQPDEAGRRGTPRRLVYVLPMRALVEQTQRVAEEVLQRLGLGTEIRLRALLGGDVDDTWLDEPERDSILIGTQDMLLSRALNRGYAQSRFAWPRAFGLLHNDAAWVLDEVQIMGSGLATTTQLAGFQGQFGTAGPAWWTWMSATAETGWLGTVDHVAPGAGDVVDLLPEERRPEWGGALARRLHAAKTLRFSGVALGGSKAADLKGYVAALAATARREHVPGSLTLVVVNTVARATELYAALRPGPVRRGRREAEAGEAGPEVLLLHSRFRPPERRQKLDALLGAAGGSEGAGTIAVCTQVVEAGVDITSRTLITELAPWASVVQRLGRLNRGGEYPEATALWADLDAGAAPPYEARDLDEARAQLLALEGRSVSPQALADQPVALAYQPGQVLRRRDLLGLFDTTADLTEVDLDVSPYVRDLDERDVQVYWRDWQGQAPAAAGDDGNASTPEGDAFTPTDEVDGTAAADGEATRPEGDPSPATKGARDVQRAAPPEKVPGPHRDELCAVPLGELRKLVGRDFPAYRRDPLDGGWRRVLANDVRPGLEVLINARAGHYTPEVGWSSEATEPVAPVDRRGRTVNALNRDPESEDRDWQTLEAHTQAVVDELERILDGLALPAEAAATLRRAARLHDFGKAHACWQARLVGRGDAAKPALADGQVMAKAPGMDLRRGRPHLRHELASALALLAEPALLDGLHGRLADLARYLVASHHGKVRMVLRSLPGERPRGGPARAGEGCPETPPRDESPTHAPAGQYALGILEGDQLPAVALGGGVWAGPLPLSLEVMQLGAESGGASWSERTRALRDDPAIGPFRLAYYEALLRAADARGSRIGAHSPEEPQ